MNTFHEKLYGDVYGQTFSIEKVLYEEKTKHQHLLIFTNEKFGTVLALDNIVQTTEKDEFIYHEMLTHTPIFSKEAVESVLIIGGGDGGILRECCKHTSVKNITMVEIDQSVVELSKQFLPKHSDGAFNDPRLNLIIDDAAQFVKKTAETFDVILVDSTDPIGPGKILFEKAFYKDCLKCLKANGILATQNGVPYMQKHELINTHQRTADIFTCWKFYTASIPTYAGGHMAFGWGVNSTDDELHFDIDKLQHRFTQSKIRTKYYNHKVHIASFTLPQYMLNLLKHGSIEHTPQ